FLKIVKEKKPATVRAMLTAQMDLAQLADAINSGLLHRFFLKPWENQVLKSQVMECLSLNQILLNNLELAKLSSMDAVTGVFNHRHFQESLQIEIDRARRHQREFSIIMVDVDNFKKVNDVLGHLAGDRLLRDVATALQT